MKLAIETYAIAILLCFFFFYRMYGQHRRCQVHRKKDDGRQPEAEEYQGEDMIGIKKLREREQIEAHNNSLRKGGYEGGK